MTADAGAGWFRHDPAAGTLLLHIHVQPGAKNTVVAGLHGDALKIRIAAPAVDGRANAELIAFLRTKLGLPAAALDLRRGTRGRRKVVAVHGATPAVLAKIRALA